MSKNRYRDVICLDSTRVVLTLNVPPESNYIHANWVKLPGADPIFIATQDPLEWTVGDFWRMIYEKKARTILMQSKRVENNKVKCAQYWPEEDGNRQKHDCLFVNNIKGGPCVVHCSAGIGRTGIIIAVETCLQRLWKYYPLSVSIHLFITLIILSNSVVQ
uniref:Tyrosine-protein phosphatase domain-containing protein n=1 Tax=Elaeophora elaphi TaxID=1147741 RepID=A0A0R3RQ05_9BILA